MAEAITVYSDYVCPFCYLGKRSLEDYQSTRERPLEVTWHPFDLRSHKRGPDGELRASVADGKDDAYYEQARENVRRLQDEYGTDEMLDPADVPLTVDSLDAQVASRFVQREHPEHWSAFDDAIFAAHWVEGRPIDDVDVLADIAEETGLDGEEIRAAIEDDALREDLREQFTTAQEHGITGVPTFVYDGHAARGAVPPEQLQRLVEGS